MHRRSFLTLAALSPVFVGAREGHAARVASRDREATIKYVNTLQNTDGGYRMASAEAPSQLGATTSALRAVKYFGGKPGSREAAVRFVRSCHDAVTGGFANVPGGNPDVRSTAMGLMCMAELKLPTDRLAEGINGYFTKHAKSLFDIYIAAAALDAAGLMAPSAEAWITEYEAIRNSDGSYGKSIADTAGAAITILRVGGIVKDREGLARLLKNAQKPDGGWGVTGDTSDLATVYRVMRGLHMLDAVPYVERVQGFIGRCRNADGGYGATPGQPSGVGPTYYAGICLKWAEEMARK